MSGLWLESGITPTHKLEMLGVPLGDAEFMDGYVERDLVKKSEEVMSKLIEFEHSSSPVLTSPVLWHLPRYSFHANDSSLSVVHPGLQV